MEFRDLKTQYAQLKKEIDPEIQDVLSSARFIGGPKVQNLEAKLADYVDQIENLMSWKNR